MSLVIEFLPVDMNTNISGQWLTFTFRLSPVVCELKGKNASSGSVCGSRPCGNGPLKSAESGRA